MNGYLRISASSESFDVEAVALKRAASGGTMKAGAEVDSWLLDCVSLHRTSPS